METLIDEDRLKKLLKDALLEVIEERKDTLYELLAEIIEDVAMTRAIAEGEGTKPVSKRSILNILESRALN